MTALTFKQFLSTVDVIKEDLQQEIDKLSMELSTVDSQINQRTQPLLARKSQLQKLLAVKQRQKGVDDKRQGNQNNTQPSQPGAVSNQTTTPGSTGAATPGSSAPRF